MQRFVCSLCGRRGEDIGSSFIHSSLWYAQGRVKYNKTRHIKLHNQQTIRSSYYILNSWCDEIHFCCLVCVTQWWALHVVIKRQFFYIFIFAVFQSQSIAESEILVLTHLINKRTPLKNLLLVSILNFLSSSACDYALK